MSALTRESRDRLFLSGRITAKHTPVKHKPSFPRRKTKVKVAATEDRYHQDALEAFHNDALTRAQLDYLQRQAAQRANAINKAVCKLNLDAVLKPGTSQRKQGKCKTKVCARSSAASGDSNSDDSDDGDGEPPRHGLADAAAFAAYICISKKTLQNIYCITPHLLPPAIHVPGARGPRWPWASIDEWLSERPQHTSKSAPVAPRKRVGRPRIALVAGKGGAR
jgi:hypothetical protein